MASGLWTRNFTLMTTATVLGAAGGVAGSFAISYLVFDETGSTLAAALLIAIQVLPNFLIPLVISPIMDRLPRKPFLVGGDGVSAVLYATAGAYLLFQPFDYTIYLLYTLLLASINAFDQLAFDAIYPKLIPKGCEEKGYSVSTMVYPVLSVVMTPVAAVLVDTVGVAWILILQGGCSLAATLIESGIVVEESRREGVEKFSLATWWGDIVDAARFLAGDRGLAATYVYMAITNGVGVGLAPILIAFFSTTSGYNLAMYSLYSAFEFGGRALGGTVAYRAKVPPKWKFRLTFAIYQLYELMDAILLWIPYPAMLANRFVCGFCGMNSAVLRTAAVQSYIPEEYRARLNAFHTALLAAGRALLSLAVGALGEVLDYRLCLTVAGLSCSLILWATLGLARRDCERIFCGEET